MRTTLKERLIKALDTDNSIVVSKADLPKASGWGYDYFAYLGLEKSNLKKLERLGFAVRGYKHANNSQKPVGPLKLDADKKLYFDKHPGTAYTKWILIADALEGITNETQK